MWTYFLNLVCTCVMLPQEGDFSLWCSLLLQGLQVTAHHLCSGTPPPPPPIRPFFIGVFKGGGGVGACDR